MTLNEFNKRWNRLERSIKINEYDQVGFTCLLIKDYIGMDAVKLYNEVMSEWLGCLVTFWQMRDDDGRYSERRLDCLDHFYYFITINHLYATLN